MHFLSLFLSLSRSRLVKIPTFSRRKSFLRPKNRTKQGKKDGRREGRKQATKQGKKKNEEKKENKEGRKKGRNEGRKEGYKKEKTGEDERKEGPKERRKSVGRANAKGTTRRQCHVKYDRMLVILIIMLLYYPCRPFPFQKKKKKHQTKQKRNAFWQNQWPKELGCNFYCPHLASNAFWRSACVPVSEFFFQTGIASWCFVVLFCSNSARKSYFSETQLVCTN